MSFFLSSFFVTIYNDLTTEQKSILEKDTKIQTPFELYARFPTLSGLLPFHIVQMLAPMYNLFYFTDENIGLAKTIIKAYCYPEISLWTRDLVKLENMVSKIPETMVLQQNVLFIFLNHFLNPFDSKSLELVIKRGIEACSPNIFFNLYKIPKTEKDFDYIIARLRLSDKDVEILYPSLLRVLYSKTIECMEKDPFKSVDVNLPKSIGKLLALYHN